MADAESGFFRRLVKLLRALGFQRHRHQEKDLAHAQTFLRVQEIRPAERIVDPVIDQRAQQSGLTVRLRDADDLQRQTRHRMFLAVYVSREFGIAVLFGQFRPRRGFEVERSQLERLAQ